MVFDLLKKSTLMKKFLLLAGFLCFSVAGFAQEFTVPAAISIGEAADYSLGERSVPSLSFLAPGIPSPDLSLREISWKKEIKREVDLVAMMEQQRYETESAYVQLEFGAPQLQNSEKGMINITNQISIYGDDTDYDPFSGKSLNPALREARTGLFKGNYSPYTGRSYYSPYSYSPFLR